MNTIMLILKGMLMGIANIIPGVSGGTIAVVLHIFDPMIEAINNFYKSKQDFKKHIGFLAVLMIGCLIGIGAFSKLIKLGLENYSFPTCMFFAGLVLGSLPLIYGKAREKQVKPQYYIATVLAFALVVGFSLLKEPEAGAGAVEMSALSFIKILMCGLIASAAMVIPGISGSFVMVLLGIYTTVITAISGLIDEVGAFASNISSLGFLSAAAGLLTSQPFFIIAAVGIGVILGIVLISKIIEILLNKVYSYTYFAVLGLILGSVFSLFTDPLTYQSYPDGMGIMPIVCGVVTLAAGVIISLLLGNEK
ncbi:MAG: DUF368 domain-containing protein [Clostridiales bacterium]|nr:DUF368 domain-containing protein [Clostridiales bacterium]